MTGLPVLRLFRRSRRRARRAARRKRNSVLFKKNVAMLDTLKRKRYKDLNSLGRLDALVLSRSVPDNRFGDNNIYKKRIYANKNLDKASKISNNSINLKFDLDSEICRARKARREEIMKKTKGKGLKVKNALWNVASFIQCRE